MTTTPMKRAGQLIAHLESLHQIRDVRQLLLLQLSMRERQDQAALFRRDKGQVTLSLIGTQLGPQAEQLNHRAGSVSAAALLDQLQALSGIMGDDVAFSSGQIAGLVDGETLRIEQSDGLARLDAALMSLVSKLEPQPDLEQAGSALVNSAPSNLTPSNSVPSMLGQANSGQGPLEVLAPATAGGTETGETQEVRAQQAETGDQVRAHEPGPSADADDGAELVSGLPVGRAARRRA